MRHLATNDQLLYANVPVATTRVRFMQLSAKDELRDDVLHGGAKHTLCSKLIAH